MCNLLSCVSMAFLQVMFGFARLALVHWLVLYYTQVVLTDGLHFFSLSLSHTHTL